ncbi:MAG: hypothetical protein MSH60_02250 [Ruminococcus sp.]|nr:hypothetical protein [Ruminococcus sp.]
MCRINEEMVNEAKQEARQEKAIEIANGLIKRGTMSFEDIAELTKLSLEEIQALANKSK